MYPSSQIFQYPQSLIEAAKLDGANDFVILLRIVIPLAKATIATFALFMLVDKWNDWYSSMLFLSDGNKFPLAKLLRDIIYNNVKAGRRVDMDRFQQIVQIPRVRLVSKRGGTG